MRGQGQDVEVVIEEDAGVVGGQTEDESLVESMNHILMCLGSEPATVDLVNKNHGEDDSTWSEHPC